MGACCYYSCPESVVNEIYQSRYVELHIGCNFNAEGVVSVVIRIKPWVSGVIEYPTSE